MNEYAVVIFTEGDLEDLALLFDSCESATCFAQGVEVGAGYYGGESCDPYVLPDQWVDLQQKYPGFSGSVARKLSDKGYRGVYYFSYD